jgi:Family of unknown function (DUF6174)
MNSGLGSSPYMGYVTTVLTAVVLSAASLTAAVPTAASSDIPPGMTDPRITDGTAQRELDAARSLWNAQHLSSYRFRVRRSCFCPQETRRERQVTVRRGTPVHPNEHVKDIANVARLFRKIQAAINAEVSSLTVTYDARRGYPRDVAIDPDKQVADEEDYFAARWLKPLP